ncbi:MAG: twin-arginine translocase TatA/TatE family subunit [Acidimicrobiales bacterium]|nr:twin-arginine translocase TatA/TatE family subunit [Acidimicrobiales bacterium]
MLALINDTGILVVVGAIVLLFGASRIPQLARNLGEASKEFRKAHQDSDDQTQDSTPLALPSSHASDQQITLSPRQLEALLASRQAPSASPTEG